MRRSVRIVAFGDSITNGVGLAGVSEEVAALLSRCGASLPAEPAHDEPGLSVRRALEAGHRVEPLD